MLIQTMNVEAARLTSLGGLGCSPNSADLLWLVSYCLGLTTKSQVTDVMPAVTSILDSLPAWRAEHESRLHYNKDLSSALWSEANSVTAVSILLARVVAKSP